MEKIYLDYAATTPVDPEVVKAMQPYFLEGFGNPSSIHSFGREARKAIEDAREKVAAFLGANPEEIVFTSGGTESNNFAIFGTAEAYAKQGNHIISTTIEHHAVLEPLKVLEKKGFKLTLVKVDKYGMVDPQEIKKAITDKTILISIMHANNEVGTIQPILEIARIARQKEIGFHTDAVQTVGHLPAEVVNLGVDLLSLSAHKFYGPKGVGALYIRKGRRIRRFLHGGDQENGRRSSTQNTAGIVGMAKAIELCAANMQAEANSQARLRDSLFKEIQNKIPDVFINGHPVQRLPNNANFSIRYIEGESILLSLDMFGLAVSTGSACTSTSLEPSHVLLAMGLSHELAHGSLRVSLGRWTKKEHIDYFVEKLTPVVEKLRKMSPIYEDK